ncbi:MAG TPA: hypothetical protein VMR92_01765, partial [Gemmatimonadales bacterium]|nr:hypothetical protein [Gemmatimonadales bacterium]
MTTAIPLPQQEASQSRVPPHPEQALRYRQHAGARTLSLEAERKPATEGLVVSGSAHANTSDVAPA